MSKEKQKVEKKDTAVEKPKTDKEVIHDFFDEVPTGKEREPIVVAIAGAQGLGKTHFSNTFPNPVIGDTEDRAQIVMQKFGHNYRKSTHNMHTIRETISLMAQKLAPEQKDRVNWTYVLDSGSDFMQFAESEYLIEAKKEKVYPTVLWAQVYKKMDQVFENIRKLGFNMVITQQLKEEYVNGNGTGVFLPAGYKKIPYRVDVHLQLQKGIEYNGEIYYPNSVVGAVLKDSWNRPEHRKPFLVDVSYDGIFKELKEYKYPGSAEKAIQAILKELEKSTGIPINKAKAANKEG